MDKRCLKKTIDFLLPPKEFINSARCIPKLLVKSSRPSKIKSEKTKLVAGLDKSEADKEFSFICSLVEIEDWLSNKIMVANTLFDVADFSSCRNPLSKLPTKNTRYVGKNKKEAAVMLMTPARILTDNHYDVLDFQKEDPKRRLKQDDYYGIIYEWIKKT